MDKACIDCGTSIGANSTRCRSCAVKFWRRDRATLRYCKTCAAEIPARTRFRAIYCSKACKFADPELRAKIGAPRNRVSKKCPYCGATFEVTVSTQGRYTYCSRECSSVARGRDGTCARCGAAFRHSQVQTRRYCCETCRRPPIVIECEICGTSFRSTPSKAASRRYCSPRCYIASSLETSIERIVRERLEVESVRLAPQSQIGPWVVDFLVGDRLVVEADGSYWHSLRPHVDRRKTADLTSRGYTVWRLTDHQIRDGQFAAFLHAALIDYECAGGDLGRHAPDQAAVLQDEQMMVSGEPESAPVGHGENR